MITVDQLKAIMPFSGSRAVNYIGFLNETMAEFDINTQLRQAAYLAQVGHESGSLLYTQELASGDAYEGRTDLGNTEPGDGPRFKGHGLLQITGRANHQAVANFFGKTIDEIVPWLITPEGAARSSGWFWQTRGLNPLADASGFTRITIRINGGTNGLADRLDFYNRALKVLA